MSSGLSGTGYRAGGYDSRYPSASRVASNSGAHSVLSEIEIKDTRLYRISIPDKVTVTTSDVLVHLQDHAGLYSQDLIDKYNRQKRKIFKDVSKVFSEPCSKAEYDACRYILTEVKNKSAKYDIPNDNINVLSEEATELLGRYPTFNGQEDRPSGAAASAEETKSSGDVAASSAQFDRLAHERAELDRQQDRLMTRMDGELSRITERMEQLNIIQKRKYIKVFFELVDMFKERSFGGKPCTEAQAIKLAGQAVSLDLEKTSSQKSLAEENKKLVGLNQALQGGASKEARLKVAVSQKVIDHLEESLKSIATKRIRVMNGKTVSIAQESHARAESELQKIKKWAKSEADGMIPDGYVFKDLIMETIREDIFMSMKGLRDAKQKNQTVTLWSDHSLDLQTLRDSYNNDVRSTGLPTLEGMKQLLAYDCDESMQHGKKVKFSADYFEKERTNAIKDHGYHASGKFINTENLRRYQEHIKRARRKGEILKKAGDSDYEIAYFTNHSDGNTLPTLAQMKKLDFRMNVEDARAQAARLADRAAPEERPAASAERSAPKEEKQKKKKGGLFSFASGFAAAAMDAHQQQSQRPTGPSPADRIRARSAARQQPGFTPTYGGLPQARTPAEAALNETLRRGDAMLGQTAPHVQSGNFDAAADALRRMGMR